MRLRQWSAVLFITCYLGCLCWGIGAHALKCGLQGNTLGYYFVWDMFCGWQAYDNRTHIIAEGASGNYYDVREPWGEFCPFGPTGRIHYDVSNQLIPKHIDLVLRHTAHEPIDRVYVVEEIWPKQYNVPDRLWYQFYNEPPDRVSYYNLRAVCAENGRLISSLPGWFDRQTLNAVADNPRLAQAAAEAVPFYNTFVTPMAGQSGSREFRTAAGAGVNTN